jgi:hypothetical protein
LDEFVKVMPAFVIDEYICAGVATRNYVAQCAGKMYAGFTEHRAIVSANV